MSCGRIRARIPDVTSRLPCNCPMSPATGSYPMPLLHLLRPLEETELPQEQLGAVVDDYLSAVQSWSHAVNQLRRIQTTLEALFVARQTDRVATSRGELLRKPEVDLGRFELDS